MNNVNYCNRKLYRLFIDAIRAEFSAIFRDGGAMLILVFATMIYTVIYSVAYGREVVTDVVIGVVDDDRTQSSRRLIDGLSSGPNTTVGYEPISINDAEDMFYYNDIYGVVYIPQGYERELLSGRQADVGVVLNGSHLLLYRQVLEQAAADILTRGAEVEVQRLMAAGVNGAAIKGVVEPVVYESHILYNPSLGYGSFVMPSILVVIIQQTMLIGIVLVGIKRRNAMTCLMPLTITQSIAIVFAKILVYIAIYGINLVVILGVIWPAFGFPYAGNTWDVITLLALYIVAVVALGLTLSHLFRRRESPFIILLWSSVPILLLAGLSYPREAFPGWLYAIGELLPSSSAVRAYVDIGTMGASLWNVRGEIFTLTVLACLYLTLAIILEKRAIVNKKWAK